MPALSDAVDLEQIERLAEKVRTLITLLDSTQTKLTETVEENNRLRVEIETAQTELSNSHSTEVTIKSLQDERKQISSGVKNILKQLEAIGI
tara:strand:+ start:123 stop:398 length:276 start_codon:yes stop_codon:yes gene_type:complete